MSRWNSPMAVTTAATLTLLLCQLVFAADGDGDAGTFRLSPAEMPRDSSVADRADLRLAADDADSTTMTRTETTHVESTSEIEDWDIYGPIRLRSADPEPPGELEIKNKVKYDTSSDGTDDDVEYEIEIEYGIAPNHELIFEVPVELFDGAVEGNGDITLGWHWRLWKEQEWLPAFGLRNFIRIPNGYHSSGVDYELRGLITKSILPNKLRVHLNPFLRSVNGDNEEEARHFQWGFFAGTDYRLTDNLVFNFDYVHEALDEGERNQHSMEAGLDWKFAEHQALGFVTRWTVDGDDAEANWGCEVSYILSFDDMPAFGKP